MVNGWWPEKKSRECVRTSQPSVMEETSVARKNYLILRRRARPNYVTLVKSQ